MARKIAKAFTVQPPDPDRYQGIPLRRFLVDFARWARDFAQNQAEPGSARGDYIAVTSGSITANAGVNGPMGTGNVVIRKINDDDTLTAQDTIGVKSVVTAEIASGKIVILRRIEGKFVIVAEVC